MAHTGPPLPPPTTPNAEAYSPPPPPPDNPPPDSIRPSGRIPSVGPLALRRIRVVIQDQTLVIGGYIVEPFRSVRRRLAALSNALDIGIEDLRAGARLAVYVALATGLVSWGAAMYLLVRLIVGAG